MKFFFLSIVGQKSSLLHHLKRCWSDSKSQKAGPPIIATAFVKFSGRTHDLIKNIGTKCIIHWDNFVGVQKWQLWDAHMRNISQCAGRHFRTKLMSGQNKRFEMRIQELASKVQNPGPFLRKNVFRAIFFCDLRLVASKIEFYGHLIL